ncbi:MAG: hypothetical protein KAY37_09415 [Phycisphaerae bacterium]|nr:hypothetical protein [Phycisphaerae bacterium]
MSTKGIELPYPKPGPAVEMPGVYVLPIEVLNRYAPPWIVEGRLVRALAPHPDRDDLLYVTTEAPDTLSFLPDPGVELD